MWLLSLISFLLLGGFLLLSATRFGIPDMVSDTYYQLQGTTGRRGLADVALSTKMWNGSNDTDYTDEEVSAIKEFVEKNFIPAVIVAVNEVIEKATIPQS